MPWLDDFPLIVEGLYTAAADATQWPAALGLIHRAFEADSAALTFQDQSGRAGTRISTGYQPGDDKRYFAGYSVQNFLYEAVVRQGLGKPVPTQNHIDKRYLERSAYYNEWLRPRNIYFCFGVILSRTQEETQWVSLNLSKGTDGFGDPHVRFMEKLVAHLQRSVSLTRQLGAITTARSAAEVLLDELDQALLLLDGRGRVIFANKSALGLLRTKDGIQSAHGGLAATCADAASRLAHLIARAARDIDGLGRRGGTVALPRRSSATPLVATLTPLLGGSESWVPNSPAVAVLLNDPVRVRDVPEETLRATFGLTPAESRLAGLLANGHPLSDAAETLRITRETARTHLARTMAKTGTSRQAELVRLLLNIGSAARRAKLRAGALTRRARRHG